jgi:hypothetical protein
VIHSLFVELPVPHATCDTTLPAISDLPCRVRFPVVLMPYTYLNLEFTLPAFTDSVFCSSLPPHYVCSLTVDRVTVVLLFVAYSFVLLFSVPLICYRDRRRGAANVHSVSRSMGMALLSLRVGGTGHVPLACAGSRYVRFVCLFYLCCGDTV